MAAAAFSSATKRMPGNSSDLSREPQCPALGETKAAGKSGRPSLRILGVIVPPGSGRLPGRGFAAGPRGNLCGESRAGTSRKEPLSPPQAGLPLPPRGPPPGWLSSAAGLKGLVPLVGRLGLASREGGPKRRRPRYPREDFPSGEPSRRPEEGRGTLGEEPEGARREQGRPGGASLAPRRSELGEDELCGLSTPALNGGQRGVTGPVCGERICAER
ncbi:uncharacterized protein M6D78_013701 [Vipera latastei]